MHLERKTRTCFSLNQFLRPIKDMKDTNMFSLILLYFVHQQQQKMVTYYKNNIWRTTQVDSGN